MIGVKQRQEPLPVPGFSVKTDDDVNNNKLKRPHEKGIPSTEVVSKKLKCEETTIEGTKINGLTNGNHKEEMLAFVILWKKNMVIILKINFVIIKNKKVI